MDPSFWKGKRVFVTGHTGFKGSWLCLWLQEAGAHVTGYALNPPTKPSLFQLARVGDGMTSQIADIRDLNELSTALSVCKAEIVFHLAAQSLVRTSYEQPVDTYAVNVMGTLHLLEAVRRVGGVRAVVNVTSDKCYENREWLWGYRESDPMGGHDPYSSSKGCAELLTASFRSSFFNPKEYTKHGTAVASARAGNVIGGGDWAADRLIPDVMKAFAAGKTAAIRNPDAVRPWQHVLEPLVGYAALAEALWRDGPKYAEAWNFGPNEEDAQPVQWVVGRLAEAWGRDASWKADNDAHPHEASYLKLDSSKARSRLNWRPRLPLSNALNSVVDWYRQFGEGADMALVTRQQIKKHAAEARAS